VVLGKGLSVASLVEERMADPDGTMAVDVVVETHALTTDNAAGVATGWRDGELSAQGRVLAADLCRRRREDGVDAVFSSDLRRAVETVRIAFAGSGIPVHLEWRLRECDYGELNGMPVSRLEAERPSRVHEPFPGGESYEDVVRRMAGFLAGLASTWNGRRVLLGGAHRNALGPRPPAARHAAGGSRRRAVRLARGVVVRASGRPRPGQ
jgi:broad specificity phosphatase PhoE